ncbi:nuclear ribonucleoprotein 1 [Orobanche minor]
MDSDQGKLFIGGISWETDEGKLKDYFQRYGAVSQTVVMREKITEKPRGFGFVVFADPNIIDTVLQHRHVIDGRTVEAKRALSRDEQQVAKAGNSDGSRNSGGGGDVRTKKIFVGGLPQTLNEDEFRSYFEVYGSVTDVVIMYDQQTSRPRGFGFISFDSEDAVRRVLHKNFHELNGKQVEVKLATPRDGGGGRSVGGGPGGGGGGYQSHGSSVDNSNSFDGRMESNRYTQPQNPSYGYNMPGYGYGPTNNGMSYGYMNYGDPAGGGGYGNPNAPNGAGYGNPQNMQGNSFGSQVASGYGYGSTQWGSANGGGGSGGAGQSMGSASGNQGYGYGGNPAGNNGAYGNQGSYGGGGYGEGNPNSGYGSLGSVSYGGGYGGGSSN